MGSLHDSLDGARFDEDSDGVEAADLQALDGIATHIQQTVFAL